MLRIKRNGDVVEVIETVMGWDRTDISYWYYNVKKWMKSATGKKNAPMTTVMDQGSIDWVKKHYI